MVVDQPGRGAVQEIGAGCADFRVRAGDLGFGFDAVRGTALAAGQPSLIPGESLCPAGQLARIGDFLPAGGDREVLDAKVHAHDGARGGKLFRAGRRPHNNQASSIAPFRISATRRRGERRFLPGLKSGVSTPQL
jgi:hypothetical protein